MLLTPSHRADLDAALRRLELARRRVDQEEQLFGKDRVAKVHLRDLRDAMVRYSYLGSLSAVERS